MVIYMKNKILLVLLSLVLCVSFAACIEVDPTETTSEATTPAETTPEVTPEATPEATPEVTPEATPETTTEKTPEGTTPDATTPMDTEPKEELTLLEQLDAVCREQIGVKYEGVTKTGYDKIINYYGEIKSGHVFQVLILRSIYLDVIASETIGDYYFGGYYGNMNKYIYVYDGEKLILLPDAYESGAVSDDDLEFVFYKWLEDAVYAEFYNDMKYWYDTNQNLWDKYDMISIELATESESGITYVIRVSPKNPEDAPLKAQSLKLGYYEFEEYGETVFIYTYVKQIHNVNYGFIETLEDSYNYYRYVDLFEIHEYWKKNVLNR